MTLPSEEGRASQPSEVGSLPLVQLEAHQRALLQELVKTRDPSLARRYLGALHVLVDEGNPDRLLLAAHAVRELMGRLPSHLGLETSAYYERMGDRIEPVRQFWQLAKGSNARGNEGTWSGAIDKALAGFLRKAEEFFDWLESARPRRRKVVADILRSFEPTQMRLPSVLQDIGIEEWEAHRDYFVRVAHQGETAEETFMSRLHACEHFLLDRFRPRTFDDLAEIAMLVRQGETSDS